MSPVNLPKDFDAAEYSKAARKFANMLPQRGNCNLNEPREMFLWMLVALPGMNGGQQAMPSSYNMLISQHLYECGAMLKCDACGYSKDPEKRYVPPTASEPHWMTAPGFWVEPTDEAPPQGGDAMDTALNALTAQQQAALFERLKKKMRETPK